MEHNGAWLCHAGRRRDLLARRALYLGRGSFVFLRVAHHLGHSVRGRFNVRESQNVSEDDAAALSPCTRVTKTTQGFNECNNWMSRLLPAVSLITRVPYQRPLPFVLVLCADLKINQCIIPVSICTPLVVQSSCAWLSPHYMFIFTQSVHYMVYLMITNEVSVGIAESLTREHFPTTKTFGLAAAHVRNQSSRSSCSHTSTAFLPLSCSVSCFLRLAWNKRHLGRNAYTAKRSEGAARRLCLLWIRGVVDELYDSCASRHGDTVRRRVSFRPREWQMKSGRGGCDWSWMCWGV